MPRTKKPVVVDDVSRRTLVVDNGGYSIKAGFSSASPNTETDCHVFSNCIAKGAGGAHGTRTYISNELEACKDFAEMKFRRPMEKGYLVSWDGELDVWKHIFFENGAKLHCDPNETNLILAEAPNCPQALQYNTDQMIFEEFGFASAYRCVGPALNAFNNITQLTGHYANTSHLGPAECVIVVDSGFSHTTVTPCIQGIPVQNAIRRLDVGGNLLTNRLKELISLRHYGLQEEPYLVNQIKEDTCFVSQTFNDHLDQTWGESNISMVNDLRVEYVLPDYVTTTRGHVRPFDPLANAAAARRDVLHPQAGIKEDFFMLGNERFVVPEILFQPHDIGLAQAGIAEVIIQSLSSLPAALWPGMLSNVLLVGGNTCITGFLSRLERELRQLIPNDCQLRVGIPADPIKNTWLGGARLANDTSRLQEFVVTKKQYFEEGAFRAIQRFAGHSFHR